MLDRSTRPAPAPLSPSARTSAATAPGIRSALDQMAGMVQSRPDQLFAVPAEYALARLGATSAALSRWERDRGLLRCLVNVGDLLPNEEPFPTDETYELSVNEAYRTLTRGQGVAYDTTDPNLSCDARAMLRPFRHRNAISVPVRHGSRIWGELWVTHAERMAPRALQDTLRVASEIAGMVTLADQVQTMARLALQDPLTGLGNRRQLDDVLDALLGDDGVGATVVICDVNDLKQVNDQFGHPAGDQVIVAVADALAESVAQVPGALAARIGGDEFALVLPGSDGHDVVGAIESISRTLARRTQPVTVSCGIASGEPGTPVRDTLALADAAQYAAKRLGHLLFLADDLAEVADTVPRRRFRDSRHVEDRRPARTPVPAPSRTEQDQTCLAVRELTEALPSAPDGTHHRLGWLAERMIELFDLDDWSVSTVDLQGERTLRVMAMGVRAGFTEPRSATELLVDAGFDLSAYPLSEQAILTGGWFVIDAQDQRADPAEREVLRVVSRRFVVAIGCSEEGQGHLLEVYGSGPRDLELLGATIALGATALLRTPLVRIVTSPRLHEPSFGITPP